MNKIISFSIWGNNPIYSSGVLENIQIAPSIYPGWKVRVYLDETVPSDIITTIQNTGTEVIFAKPMNPKVTARSWEGLFWRFCPASDDDVAAFIVRDADSRINAREKSAVDTWMSSRFKFHSMRDHWNHNVPIMGGMWGAKKGAFPWMRNEISKWLEYEQKGTDQIFLKDVVWPKVKRIALAHDKYYSGFFRLPSGEILLPKSIAYYNKYDNCGDDKDYDFPRGKIVLNDGRAFQRLDVYHYDPLEMFGNHTILPFPPHDQISDGSGRYVGESSQDYCKPYDIKADTYL